jgi:hypothetical protein
MSDTASEVKHGSHSQREEIAKTLRMFSPSGGIINIQSLPRKGSRQRPQSSYHTTIESATATALRYDKMKPQGVYFTLNQIAAIGEDGTFPKNADIVRRLWLPIDCDPIRPAGTNADEEQRHEAALVIAHVEGQCGLCGAVRGDSGNGSHLAYPIDLPADEASRTLVKRILEGLQRRCGNERASIGTECYDARRIWPCYGTIKRKGEATAERPHRLTRIIDGEPRNEETARANTAALPGLLRFLERRSSLCGKAVNDDPVQAYVAKAFQDELSKLASAPVGERNDQLNKSSFAIGQLVGAGVLTRGKAEAAIKAAAEQAGCDDPPKDNGTIRRGLDDGIAQPRDLSHVGNGKAERNGRVHIDSSDPQLDQDATVADLIRANATIRWAWEKWFPIGVLTILASEPGVGKTRLCADLARRVYHGLVWPDGSPASFPQGSPTLWVAADCQHAELASLVQAFAIPPEALFLNTTRRYPFGGTMLDAPDDLKGFEARIARVKPALVFVDTTLKATDRTSHKPEDAKAFFVPLQQIAQRQDSVLVCVTHLNAGGKPLGRRIEESGRVVIMLERPDPEGQPDRRKLYVKKSHSLYPAALGVSMGDKGNEYDDKPPTPPTADSGDAGAKKNPLGETVQWLESYLQTKSCRAERVYQIRNDAEEKGISSKTLYKAKDKLGIEEFLSEGKKWWRLTTKEDT